jgi:DNA mismatch repair protein MutH
MMKSPSSQEELMQRCHALAGYTLGQLAKELDCNVPVDLKREKGWTGQLIEQALGATSGSKAEPDFPELGIELKTLPISRLGKPLESTYVCVAPLTGVMHQRWHESWVCRKLSHVLWLPVLAERDIPVAERVIGTGFLWQPNHHEHQLLQQDWEELMELIALGGIDRIKGEHGHVLQLRPKAANSKALTSAVGTNGEPIQTLPRGFYLKASFTQHLLNQAFS